MTTKPKPKGPAVTIEPFGCFQHALEGRMFNTTRYKPMIKVNGETFIGVTLFDTPQEAEKEAMRIAKGA